MPHAPLLAFSLTFSLAFSFGIPGSAFASAWAPVRGSVEVDTSAVGEEGPALKKRIQSTAGDLLLENEVLPARDPADARFRVVVQPAPGDEPGWVANVHVERDGEIEDGSERAIDCQLCTEGELVDKVTGALGELIPEVVAASEAAEPAEGPVPEGSQETDPSPVPDAPPKDRKLGTLGYAGIGAAALGVVGMGVGVGLMAKGHVVLDDDPSQRKNYVKPGAASLAVGGVALVAGAALLVVDRLRAKKGANTVALPTFGPDHAGVTFVTRF